MKTHRPYRLQEYNPEWKDRFLRVAEKIKSILGDNLLDIEHIGSTSIKGMLAKPQVDVLVIVKDLTLVEDARGNFEKAGFTVHGIGYVTDDNYYVTEDASGGVRMTSVHILQEGNPKIEEIILFRDYLIDNTEDRELYIRTKKDLYLQHSDNYADYDNGKRDIIQEINLRARAWLKSRQ